MERVQSACVPGRGCDRIDRGTSILGKTRTALRPARGPSRAILGCLLILAGAGCSRTPPAFHPNLVYARKQKLARRLADFESKEVRRQIDDIERLVTFFFGTPDQPALPPSTQFAWKQVLDLKHLQRAAGPVRGEGTASETGLFRRCCARCHGISGDGHGPMAPLLDPYPHDFRRGIFKFKSTPSTLPPTRDDLRGTLDRGIPGTAMPAFSSLSPGQREALIQYVKYLSIRGQFEREMITVVAFELDEGEQLVSWRLEKQHPDRFQQELEPWLEVADAIGRKWLEAKQHITPVPPHGDSWESAVDIARGRQLFFSSLTNCAECHGNTALGDGQTDDYDEWAKELEPTNPAALHDYLALGALPPRKVRPRDLREGIFRGGDALDNIFRRIRDGVAGTTMPSIATEVSDADIWRLVAFVRRLPRDKINR